MAAQDVQGMLVRIEATTAQLRAEMKRADAAVADATKGIDKQLSVVDKAFANIGVTAGRARQAANSAMLGIAAGAATAVAGVTALTKQVVDTAREVQNFASVSNSTTLEFQRFAAGAKAVGIEQDKLADILKDVNDRVGDFLTTGGGEMKDFFDNIAPKIGVTAEQFRKLSGPQSLQLFYNGLEKANLSQAEMTFYMESMADETTALIPLLRNGGAGFKLLGDEAERAGAILDDKAIRSAQQMSAALFLMNNATTGVKNKIAEVLLPVLVDFSEGLNTLSVDGAAASIITDDLAESLRALGQGAVGTVAALHLAGKSIKGIIDLNEASKGDGSWWETFLPPVRIYRAFESFDDIKASFGDTTSELDDLANSYADFLNKIGGEDGDQANSKIKSLAEFLDQARGAAGSFSTSATGAAKAIEAVDKAIDGIDANGAADAIKEYKKRFDDLHDSLNPAEVAAREYAEQQEFLNDVIARGGDDALKAVKDLDLLREQYEANTTATSDWAKWTEGALDRVDSAFADAWRNIGDGFSSFRNSLTDAFKQMLAELAHMAITKPIIMQIGASMGIGSGTQGNNGIWGSLLGGGSGSSGSGVGGALGTANQVRSLYSMYGTAQSLWPALQGGFTSGGFGGALGAGASAIGSMFGMGSGAAASTAAGSVASGYTGAAMSGWVAAQSANTAATSALTSAMAQIGAMATNPVTWVVAAALSGYQGSKMYSDGVRADAGEIMGQTDSTLGKAALVQPAFDAKIHEWMDGAFRSLGVSDKALSWLGAGGAIHQALWGADGVVSKALFGGSWQTKDYGLGLGVEGGEFDSDKFEYRKKKGGLFSSSKKKTIWSELDPELATALQETYDATEAGVASLFESLSLTVEEGSLAGLQLAREQISTKGKTEEEIQQAISEWFVSAGDAMSRELNNVLGTGLDFDLASMTSFVGNLYGLNDALKLIKVELFDTTVQGGHFSEALLALMGGLEGAQASIATYYDAFFSDAEKQADTLASVTEAFKAADITLADSREGYRSMVEDIDRTTESGRQMFASMMGLADEAATYYSIVEQQAAEALAKAQADAAQAAAVAAQAAAEAAAIEQARIDGILGTVSTAFAAAQRAIAAEQQAVQQEISATTAAISGLEGVSSSLDSALKRLRGSSDDTVRMLRAQATMTLNSALVTARAGGSLAQFAGLEDALDVASEMDTALYGSLADFEREQGRTANLIAELEKVNGKQLSAEERMLEQYESQSKTLDEQLSFAQSQLDALNGIDTSVLSVADAVVAMNSAVVTALGVLANGLAPKNTAGNNATLVESVYKDLFGRDADKAGSQFWQGQLNNGSANYADLADQMLGGAAGGDTMAAINKAYQDALGRNADAAGAAWYASQIASGAIKASDLEAIIKGGAKGSDIQMFASGGLFNGAGGAFVAGEGGGPELVVSGPARIHNARDTAAIFASAGETAGEVRALRQEVAGLRSALGAIAKHTESTAYGVRRMNDIGLPQEDAA